LANTVLQSSVDQQADSHDHHERHDPFWAFEEEGVCQEKRVFEKAETTLGKRLTLVAREDLEEPMPLELMSRILRGWAKEASIVNAEGVEVYPLNANADGRWIIIPYANAGKDERRLGDTYLQTADGVPIPFDELSEWIVRTANERLEVLAAPEAEEKPAPEETPGKLLADGLKALKKALLEPGDTLERHGSIVAALNIAERKGQRAAMQTFLKSDELRAAWVKDGSRNSKEWADEVDRWAKAKTTNKRYGFPFLKTQGFNIPKLERKEPEEAPWGAIEPLPNPNPPAPPLPPELIPEAFRDWLVDVSERLCIPIEMPAAAAIVAAGGTLGRGVGIYPQRYDDWLVYPNLWGGILAKPGMMKSPLIAESTKAQRRLEAASAEEFEKAAAAHDVRRERLELEMDACRKLMKEAIAKGKDTADTEARLISLKQEVSEVPASPRRFVVQDSTVEKLGELLQANPRGLLLLRDELAGWLRSLERPGREGDREFYLETWSGDGAYTFDRIKRGTIRIPHLSLSVFGGIQPGKLKRYIQDATSGGEGADGLLQRMQVVVWPESLGEWVNTDRRPNREAWTKARAVYDALANHDALSLGIEPDEDGRAGLRFSAEAQEVFYEWRGALEQRVRSGELDHVPAFTSHLSKYRSLMPALALLFHLIGLASGEHDRSSVGLSDATRAADWCDYLEAHARRLYHGELERVTLAAHAILEKIKDGEIKHETKVRDLYRAEWEDLNDRTTVLEALELMTERGYLRVGELATGGRPSVVIHLHPELRR
jgi:putative DNA primase/helicase